MLKHFLAAGLGLLIGFMPAAYADTIVLKNGKRIKVEQTWKEDGQIKCERFGSVIGYPESMVDRVETGQLQTPKIEAQAFAKLYSSIIEDLRQLKRLAELDPPPDPEKVRTVSERITPKTTPFTKLIGSKPIDAEGRKANARHSELAKAYLERSATKRQAGDTDGTLKDNYMAQYYINLCMKTIVDSVIRTENLDILIINDL